MSPRCFLLLPTVLALAGEVILAAPVQGQDAAAVAVPTYTKDVAPIIFQNCVVCHRNGEVAPFPLLTYEDAKKHARNIAKFTARRIMPPWKPDPEYGGHFVGERHLTDEQIATIGRWVEGGAPEGNPADLPSAPRFTSDWELGEPDLVIRMPKPFTIPAEGNDVYRSFIVPLDLPADRYVRAAEFRPGNRRIVHHVTVTLDTRGKARALEAKYASQGLEGFPSNPGFGKDSFIPSGGLPGFVPGMGPTYMAADAALTLPHKADVLFNMHYHPTGKEETDQSCIGLYFTDRKPTRVTSFLGLIVVNLEIQPGETDHPESTSVTLPVDVEVRGISPHMHLIGKTAKLWAELPDKTIRPLIKINHWNFNWQGTYACAEPFRLPKGTVIHGEWTHDNSADNPHNPSVPPRLVRTGENSTDEMAAAWFDVVVDNEKDNGTLWMSNLAHIARSALTPPKRAKPAYDPRVGVLGSSALLLIAGGCVGAAYRPRKRP